MELPVDPETGSLFPTYMLILACLAVVCVVYYIWQLHRQSVRRRQVMEGESIAADAFLRNWRVGKRGSGLGYAAIDQSGCYVILTNSVSRGNGDVSYDAVYVGQSVHVCSRVRQHLTGHGNGDVYADVRDGKDVQIRIVPCTKKQMKDVERELIAAFHATDYYNRTRGGSKRR